MQREKHAKIESSQNFTYDDDEEGGKIRVSTYIDAETMTRKLAYDIQVRLLMRKRIIDTTKYVRTLTPMT